MKAWKVSLAEAREESSSQGGEDDEGEISGGVDDAAVRSHWEGEWEGGGSLQQTEAVVRFSQGEGSLSSRMVTLVTLCVPVRWIAFCPPVEWGGEMPM